MVATMSNWWHATVHWVAISVGIGFLSFPSAMVYLSWWPGMLMITVCWIATLHTLWKIIDLHDEGGGTFAGLGRLAWGPRGAVVMKSLQVLAAIAVNINYLIAGGYSLRAIFGSLGYSVIGIVAFAGAQFIGSFISSLSGLVPFSAASLVAGIGYAVAIIGLSVHERRDSHPQFSIPEEHRIPKTFNALGNIGFAFSGHYLAMEVQSSLACASSSEVPMWQGILVSYIVIALCYFTVAAIGYSTFGNRTCNDNILQLLWHPGWASKLANVLLLFHLTIGYQIRAVPVYALLEHYCSKNKCLSWLPRYAVRLSLIGFTCMVAVLLPFFGEVMGIVGGLALVPSSLTVPCLVWLTVRKPKILTPPWLVSVAWILFGILLSVISLVGSLWGLIAMDIGAAFHLPHKNCSSS